MKRMEHDLNQSSMIMFQPLIFRGVGQYLFVGEVVFLHSRRTFLLEVLTLGIAGSQKKRTHMSDDQNGSFQSAAIFIH